MEVFPGQQKSCSTIIVIYHSSLPIDVCLAPWSFFIEPEATATTQANRTPIGIFEKQLLGGIAQGGRVDLSVPSFQSMELCLLFLISCLTVF